MAQGSASWKTTNSLKNWAFQYSFFSSFKKKDEDNYIVAPRAPLGEAYILNEDQFQVFKSWYFDKIITVNRPLHVRIMAALTALAILALLTAGIKEHISMGLATILMVIISTPTFWITYKAWRMNMNRMMETFPFPQAPTAQYRFGTWLERFCEVMATMSFLKWAAWLILAIEGTYFLFIFIATGLAVFAYAIDPTQMVQIDGIGLMFAAVVLRGALLAIPFAILIPRHKFKRRTGKPLTLENLYLSEVGSDFA